MKSNKTINRVITNLMNGIKIKPEGGSVNLTGCTNRYTVGAKTIVKCLFRNWRFDDEFYSDKIYKELFNNYISKEFPVSYDSIGWWINDETIYIDLGFRFSDKSDALKFAQFNGEIAIYDNKAQKDILVNNYNL